MQNNQQFVDWLWQNHPWMLVLLVVSWMAMIAFLLWVVKQAQKRPAEALSPLSFAIIAVCVCISSFCGWYYWPNDGRTVWRMVFLAFVGLIPGGCIATVVQWPKPAVRGAIVGVVISMGFFVIEVLLSFQVNRDLWSNQAWESRGVMTMMFVVVSAVTACMIRNHPSDRLWQSGQRHITE
ncbi:MAG: hypothetical protein WEB58_20525 [Planctomycetaceae bacterium]